MSRAAVRLVRRPPAASRSPVLDESQRRVVDHRGGPQLVLAGPGTGKTTTLVEAVADRVERDGLDPEQILVLTFSRRAAGELRDQVARRLNRTVREPMARTFHSYAFGLLRREAVQRGEPMPRLLAGAEQDVLIREILRGDVEELGAGYWPARLRPALLTRGFADELRDLLMRAVERGLGADDLIDLGRHHGRDDWQAAGRFAGQYAGVTALRSPPSFDQAELVRAATALLREEPGLLRREREARAFVVVDEYQDSDPAQEELLQLLVGGGRDLLVVGDPDQSIYGFRGAEVEGIRRFAERFPRADGAPATVNVLEVSRRCGPALLAASRRVAARLGGPRRHRVLRAADPGADGEASVHVLASASQEAAFIASRMREAHLMDEVAWSSMAVVVRTASAIPVLRRALAAAGVPVAVRLDEVPLIEQPPVRALLRLLEVATGRRELDADLAYELVTGPFGGADALALRRLRQELRVHELATGGRRASGELLVEALGVPGVLVPLDDSAVRPAAAIAALIELARTTAERPGVTAEDVLWAVWSRSGLTERWTRQALGGGAGSGAADRDLDAVVALFDAVARYVDRMPGAGPLGFVEHLRDQQLPADTLSGGSQSGSAVTILTAHAAKGLEWDVVTVAGVQEGVWPDVRERGTLLGTERLVDLLADRDDHAVTRASARLAEERRLFYVAVTRARRRLYVTAVAGDDEQPSRFLDDLDPVPAGDSGDGLDRPVERPGRGLDLASLVAELRAVVCDPVQPPDRRDGAAVQLARLAGAGVRQADPSTWYGLRLLSIADPLGTPGEPVRVSPSKVEEFNRCELRWLLKACGATDSDMSRAGIGSLVHDLAERAAVEEWSDDTLLAELDRAWPGVDVGEGWAAAREYTRVREMVERLGRWMRANPRRLVGVEVEFDVEIGSARLAGRVDRLDADGEGRLVVVDYKTGKSAPTKAEIAEHAQLAAYQLAVEHGGFDEPTDDPGAGDSRSGYDDPGVGGQDAAGVGGADSADESATEPAGRDADAEHGKGRSGGGEGRSGGGEGRSGGGEGRSGGATLVQLGKPVKGEAGEQHQSRLADADDPSWADDLLQRTAEGMSRPVFHAQRGQWCGFCPARPSCPVHPEGEQVIP